MRKSGFTLAELLLSLSIIGVIAAITLPSLNRNTVEAQIGPKLAKAVSVFEQANTALLNDEGIDSFSDSNYSNVSGYVAALSRYMKGSVNGSTITTKDGVSYNVTNMSFSANSSQPPHMVIAGASGLTIDINGSNNLNADGEDKFYFSINNDGSLRPKGAINWDGTTASADNGDNHWKKKCPNDQVPTDAAYCAGSIFEQNLKVMYK